jgi:hypothetical protein
MVFWLVGAQITRLEGVELFVTFRSEDKSCSGAKTVSGGVA